jgi:hypothetical protein
MSFLEFVGTFFTLKDTFKLVVSGVILLILNIIFLRFIFRKEYRLFKNLGKPILFLNQTSSQNTSFGVEINLFKQSKIFNVKDVEETTLNVIRNERNDLGFIVVGVSNKTQNLSDIVECLTKSRCPSIIYTFGDSKAIKPDDMQLIYKYQKIGICNTSTRLIGDVFSILSVYPNE